MWWITKEAEMYTVIIIIDSTKQLQEMEVAWWVIGERTTQWLQTTNVCKSHACTCPLALSQAVLHPETPRPQWQLPRRQEGGFASSRSPASQWGICGDCLCISQKYLLILHSGSLGRFQLSSICLPPCGREHSSDPLTVACWGHSQSLHLIEN